MATETGEYLVGAYLKLIEGCDFVDYNVRTPGGGLAGLNELDVVGLRFDTSTAYICEVTTHILGLLYKDNRSSINKLRQKHETQRRYAETHLKNFGNHVFEFWSPVVPRGYLTEHLPRIEGLSLVINGEYKRRVHELLEKAKSERHPTGNPVFRVFQILGALRD